MIPMQKHNTNLVSLIRNLVIDILNRKDFEVSKESTLI